MPRRVDSGGRRLGLAGSLVASLVLAAGAFAADPFDELDAARSRGRSGGPSAEEREAFEAFKERRRAEFAAYREQLEREFRRFQGIVEEEQGRAVREIAQRWDDPRTSSRTVWVEYSEDLRERRSVDFEREEIVVETLAPSGDDRTESRARDELRRLLLEDRATAFEKDRIAQAVEIRSRKEIELLETAEVEPLPILIPYLTGEEKIPEARLERIIDGMLDGRRVEETRTAEGERMLRWVVPLAAFEPAPMPTPGPTPGPTLRPTPESALETGPAREPEEAPSATPERPGSTGARDLAARLSSRARSVWRPVDRYARKVGLDPALVLAVIQTESNFNPRATSHIPAYGLMQIVPGSAGLDVTEVLFGKGRILAPSYLYDAEKNIEAGATFLDLLLSRYLRGVRDPRSRLYCAIAGYNTGAGNVFKAFTGKTRSREAFARINRMTPSQVYAHLVRRLPYEETRHYLPRVVERMERFGALLAGTGD